MILTLSKMWTTFAGKMTFVLFCGVATHVIQHIH